MISLFVALVVFCVICLYSLFEYESKVNLLLTKFKFVWENIAAFATIWALAYGAQTLLHFAYTWIKNG